VSEPADHSVTLNFPACLEADFTGEFPPAATAVNRVLKAIEGSSSFAPLEDRSPGLRGNDWSNYLRCSEARMVHAVRLLSKHGVRSGRVLDYGSYFGNFALMMRARGFDVDALDAFEGYRPSLDPILELLHGDGINTLDFGAVGGDLAGIGDQQYDVVLCMGVIEHIPHTPRLLLDSLRRVLKPGGCVVMDTPNLAQLPNRQRLAKGQPVMTPIAIQYHATIPFEGHHREYTADEMAWMIQEAGFELLALDLYNYSVYGHDTLFGRDAINHWRMVANPTMRELVMVVGRRPNPAAASPSRIEWPSVFEDAEGYWLARLPANVIRESGEEIVGNELLLVDLQDGIATRDRMLAELQASSNKEVSLRDSELSVLRGQLIALQGKLNELQMEFDMTPSERLKRAWRRWTGTGPRDTGN
jgi:2-polyprenyl-3-methyl-5-hydroxy-6-metoxy-1,4-benzoquinol methylase